MVHVIILVVKESVVLWFNIVHILSFISCISPSLLTDPLEQQDVSCESTVCSMCYDVCIVPHDCIYTDCIVRVFSKLFDCLPGNGCWSPILKVKGVKFCDFREEYSKY